MKFPKLQEIITHLRNKESLSTIEEQSFDISNEGGTARSNKFSSLISCEPFDLNESIQGQLPNDNFLLKIDKISQDDENESSIRQEMLY